MASMQALLAIQLLLTATVPNLEHSTKPQAVGAEHLLGRFWRFDAKSLQWHSARLTRDPECEVCAPSWNTNTDHVLKSVHKGELL